MTIPVRQRQALANRLQKAAEEEDATGAKSVATEFRRRAQELLAGIIDRSEE